VTGGRATGDRREARCKIFSVTGRRGMEARGQGYNGH
jgi:hypothetical protein